MPGVLCEHCNGYCCRYIALPIDKPKDRADFDDIRWYLLHQGVNVFIEDGDWYIGIETTCRHLLQDHRCGIYEKRPQVCRDYSTDNCDYHSGDYGWEQHFTRPEHLDEYARTMHAAKRRARGRTRGKTATPHKPTGRLKVRLTHKRPRPSARGVDYAAASTDSRGIPLPLLVLPHPSAAIT